MEARALHHLFREARIGNLRLKNRAVMPAMGTGYADSSGRVTDRLVAYLRARAEGGAALIITEVCAVHPGGKGFPNELGAYDDSFLPGLSRLAREVKEAGAAVALQLHHAGRETHSSFTGQTPVAPSPIPSRLMGEIPRELTREEIWELVEAYASAARRAVEAGFDAVELHGAHGYLLHQFVSPRCNAREDEFGGEGRFRFPVEVVKAVRETVGPDFPVIYRFSADEEVRDGYHLDYILGFLPLLEEAGVDAFHVSCGVGESPGNPVCPGMHHREGWNVDRAAVVKSTVNRPVIVVGKIHDPFLADRVLEGGKADMVAFGRQHLADPYFLAKAAEGKAEEIRSCLSCNQGCIERLALEMKPITCTVNPECGEEYRGKPGRSSGRFLVVGGGPAGLQAAYTLASAGAEVRLVERENELGGQLKAAAVPPGKEPYLGWRDWMRDRLEEQARVELIMGRELTVDDLDGMDGVILATGANPIGPDIESDGSVKTVLAVDVLLGKEELPSGGVMVAGSGLVGMETACFLLERGFRVCVAEEKETPGVLPLSSHGYYLHRRLRDGGKLLLGCRVIGVKEGKVILDRRGEILAREVACLVWAVGSRPERTAEPLVREAGFEPVWVGDAVEPRRVLEAVKEGYEKARELLEGKHRATK